MIYDEKKRLILPDRLAGPRRQRGSIILAAASLAGSVRWDLSDLDPSYPDLGISDNTYGVQLVFRTDATVDVLKDINADELNEQDPYVDPPGRASVTWVRCTHNSGDDMTAGDTRGDWHQLDTQRDFQMRHTAVGGGDALSGDFDFELSSDASGSPITASALGMLILVGRL